MAYMPANDAPSAKLATAYVTIDGNRYACLMAKSFEGKMNVESYAKVPAEVKERDAKKLVELKDEVKKYEESIARFEELAKA